MDGCYGGGSIAAAVIGTFVSTLVAVALAHFVWKRRKERQNPLRDLVLVENGEDKLRGFENRGFKDDLQDDASQNKQGLKAGDKTRLETGTPRKCAEVNGETGEGHRKSSWTHLGFFFNHGKGTGASSENPQGLNYSVNLKGHDFTGLGFTLGSGGGKPGVFIKEVMQRGPAAETHQMLAGDRIRSVSVSFDDIVLPDAVAIIGHASPYSLKLDLTRPGSQAGKSLELNSSDVTDSAQNGVIDRPPMISESSSAPDRASSVRIEMESVQMKSPDILDLRPSAFPRNKDKKQANNSRHAQEGTEVPSGPRPPTPKIECSDVPDAVLHHMEGLTSKEAQPIVSRSPEIVQIEHKISDVGNSIPVEKISPPQAEEIKKDIEPPTSDLEIFTPALEKSNASEKPQRPKSLQDELSVAASSADVISKSMDKDRPASADSASSKAKFHIRLFHKSKQYSLDHEPSPQPSDKRSSLNEDELHATVRKMEIDEVEGMPNSRPQSKASCDESAAKPKATGDEIALKPKSGGDDTAVKPDRPHEESFVSKGLKSIRDLKEKVAHRLSIHDSPSSDSESTEHTGHGKGRKKKEKSADKKSKTVPSPTTTFEVPSDSQNGSITVVEISKPNAKDDDSSGAEDESPKRPKKSTKRKAPIPPTDNSAVSTTVEIHSPVDPPAPLTSTSATGIESKRCASYGDLPCTPAQQLNQSDRAVSLDLQSPKQAECQMSLAEVVNDLSCAADRPLHIPALNSSESTSSSSPASSSSETLTEGKVPTTYNPMVVELNGDHDSEHSSQPVSVRPESKPAEVGISPTGNGTAAAVVPRAEIERIATETVREILRKAQENLEANPDSEEVRKAVRRSVSQDKDKKPSRIPVPAGKSVQSPSDTEAKSLRDDRKTRLMQTVADANDIKLSPPRVNPPKTIELSAKELDSVMMSHAEFLARQETGPPPPKDSSFDTWVYVDQKHHPTPSPVLPQDRNAVKDVESDSLKNSDGETVFSTTMTLPVNTAQQTNSETEAPEQFLKLENPKSADIQLPALEAP